MLRHLFICCSFVLLSLPLLAQKPLWADPSWRLSNRGDQEYFVAFISGFAPDGQDAKELLDKFEEQAKGAVIQQIQVNIETTTDLMVANVNAETTEAFKSKSVALARADIAGLRTERYHDQKKRELFAIAWVKKAELVFYYRNSVDNLIGKIETKIKEAENLQGKKDKSLALKAYYETMPSFNQLEEAQLILIALGLKSENELRFGKGNQLMLQVKDGITALQQSPRADIEELSYFMAYGLFLQLGSLSETIVLKPVTFESSGLKSEFSDRFQEALSRSLVKAGGYKIAASVAQTLPLQAEGTYRKEGEALRVSTVARRNGVVVAAAEVMMPLSWIRENKINWVPENFVNINKLKNISLTAISEGHEGRTGRPLNKPLTLKVMHEGQPLANAPLVFVADEKILARATTNNMGVAEANFAALEAARQTQLVLARFDVAAFAGIENGSPFLRQVENTWPITPARFLVAVKPLTVFVNSSESMPYNLPLNINILEPVLKETLAAKGFAFAEKMEQADLMVTIEARSRNGSNMQGIFFSFVDATVAITDLHSGRETFKQSFSSIKGGGADFERAAIKAFEETAKEIKLALPDKIN
jgi:hypothetical protein